MKQCKGGIRWIAWVFVLIVGFQKNAEGLVALTPSLTVSERYNDNLFFRETNREGEFTTMLSPQFTLAYSDRDLAISGRYEGNAEFHLHHPEANRYGQSLSFDLSVPALSQLAKGLEIRVTESVTYTPELPPFSYDRGDSGNLPREGNEGIEVGRTDTFRNRAGVTVAYIWTPLFDTALSYANLINRYQGGELQDYTVHDGSFVGIFHSSRQMRWTASYAVSLTDYEQTESVAVHQLGVGNSYQIGPTLSADVSTGIAMIPGDQTQWVLNAEMKRGVQSGGLSVRYTRGIGSGGGLIAAATLSENVVAQVRRVLSRATSAYLQLGYGKNRTLSSPLIKITSNEIGTGLQISLLSWLNGTVSYSYLSQRVEGGTGEDARRNQVMVGLTATALPLKIF